MLRIVQAMRSHLPQRGMVLGECEWPSAFFDRIAITLENLVRSLPRIARYAGKERAGREANEVVGIGQRGGFVKIVDAPNQPALHVAPGAEVFDMEIAYSERAGRARFIRTMIAPDLR